MNGSPPSPAPRISGITLAYNAVSTGYPLAECIRSMLPLVDEVVANIGASDDGTKEAIAAVGSDKVRLLEDPWNMGLREKGLALSAETNRAKEACGGDWILYLQADEVLHERETEALRECIHRCHADPRVEGISFKYLHFYGSPGFVQDHRFRWYTRAVRAVRNRPDLVSVSDALKWRRRDGARLRRLREFRSGIHIYHYGWARPPEVMLRKARQFSRFYHDDAYIEKNFTSADVAQLYPHLGNLVEFAGTHPAVMKEYVSRDWKFDAHLERQWPEPLRRIWIWSGYLAVRALQKAWGKLRGRPWKR